MEAGCREQAREKEKASPHIHYREDETFQVLGGDYERIVGGETFVVRQGATIFAPPVCFSLSAFEGRPLRSSPAAEGIRYGSFQLFRSEAVRGRARWSNRA
jgi:hypothetical protein